MTHIKRQERDRRGWDDWIEIGGTLIGKRAN